MDAVETTATDGGGPAASEPAETTTVRPDTTTVADTTVTVSDTTTDATASTTAGEGPGFGVLGVLVGDALALGGGLLGGTRD